MNAGVSKGGFLILAALLGASDWALTRAHGRLRLFTRTEPFTASRPIETAFFAGNTAETIRRMKRIPIGFIAFDENEPLDEALERLFLTVADYAAETAAFDLLLRSAPNGRYPLLHTLRASDTTLYDVLHLACRSAGVAFDVRGTCIIVGAQRNGH